MSNIQSSITTHLDHDNFWLEPGHELGAHLAHQLRVRELLAHLHDAHDGRLDQHLAVLLDVLLRRLLLHLDLVLQRIVDVDPQLLTAINTTFELN